MTHEIAAFSSAPSSGEAKTGSWQGAEVVLGIN